MSRRGPLRRWLGRRGAASRTLTVLLAVTGVAAVVAAVLVSVGVLSSGPVSQALGRTTAAGAVATSAGDTSGVADPVHWPAAVFLGDSWTAGNDMGGRGGANYSAILAARNRWYPTNLSYGGTSYDLGSPTEQFGSATHLRALAAARPDVVFIVNGVNDINRVGLAEWRSNAGATYDAVRAAAPNAVLVVVGPIAPGPAAGLTGYREWDDALGEVAQEHGAVYVDAYAQDWFGGTAAAYIGSDRFHPDDAGQTYLASRLQDDLDRLGVTAEVEKTRESA